MKGNIINFSMMNAIMSSVMSVSVFHLDGFNPIAYGILRFRQLRGGGGGAFWPRPKKQGYGYLIAFKFATNNGTDDTSKHGNLKLLAILLLEI